MKSTLNRYLFREIATPFLVGMAVFTAVLLMGRLLKLAEMVIAKGVPLASVLRMVLYMLPSFCLVTIPMALLLAVLLGMGRLSADSEVTAIKASGISLYGFLPPVLCFTLLAYLATAFVTIYALPWGNQSFKSILAEIARSKGSLIIRERVFDDQFKGVVMYVDRFNDETNRLTGVLIHDDRKVGEAVTIFAKNGTIFTEPGKNTLRLELQGGAIHRAMDSKGYRLINFGSYDLTLDMNQTGDIKGKNERDMTFAELKGSLSVPQPPKAQRELEIEYHRRFSLPFACFVFAILGIPLGMQNRRSGKSGGFAMSIGVLLLFYVLQSAGERLALAGTIPAAPAVWGPNLAFLVLGIYLFILAAAERSFPLAGLFNTCKGWFHRRAAGRKGAA